MKVAVLGGYGPMQSVGAVYRAFQRAGHEVVHVQTLPGLAPDAQAVLDGQDLVFTFKIGHRHIPVGFIKNLKVTHKVFWSFDDPHWIEEAPDVWLAAEHDLVFTSCLESIATYETRGIHDAFYMPPAMDLQHYHDWTLDRHTRYPCSFICTNLYRPDHFPRNLLSRSLMVDELTRSMGKDFGLYGYGAEIEKKKAWKGALNWESTLPRVIERTAININNHVIADRTLYLNERFFQITATVRAQFVDRVKGLEETFGPDSFVYYSSLAELMDKVSYYTRYPEKLEQIGQRGYAAVKGWTYDAFVDTLVASLESTRVIGPTFLTA